MDPCKACDENEPLLPGVRDENSMVSVELVALTDTGLPANHPAPDAVIGHVVAPAVQLPETERVGNVTFRVTVPLTSPAGPSYPRIE